MTESVTLTLSTSVLTKNGTNNYGYCNDNMSAFRFDNINLRLLLGDLYDKYSTFNIQLNTIFNATGQSTPLLNFLTVRFRGLKFINDGYNWMPNTPSVSLGIVNLNSGYSNGGLNFVPVNVNNTFKILNELVNFDIQLCDVRSDTLTTQAYTNVSVSMGFVFLFTITPVK